MSKRKILWVFLIVVLFQTAPVMAASKQWPQGTKGGTTVVLKVPAVALHFEGTRQFTDIGLSRIYGIDVEELLSDPSWKTKSSPALVEYEMAKIGGWKNTSGKRFTQVDVCRPGTLVRLRFDPSENLDSRFQEVVAIGTVKDFKQSEYFRKNVIDVLDQEDFVGPLTNLSLETKRGLLEIVDYRRNGISSGTYKGNAYLSIDLGSPDTVFNSLRLDQSARVARVVNDKLLSIIRQFASAAEEAEVSGIKVVTVIPHKSFLDDLVDPTKDRLEVYVLLEEIRQFLDAEITSQQLMDASIILLNDNRIQVVLTSGAS